MSASHFGLSLPVQVEQLSYEVNEEHLFGRGSHQQCEVDYSEILTEREWLKVVEDGTLEEVEEHVEEEKEEAGPPPRPRLIMERTPLQLR